MIIQTTHTKTSLRRMRILAYRDAQYAAKIGEVQLLVNPKQVQHTTEEIVQGGIGVETFSFEFVLDTHQTTRENVAEKVVHLQNELTDYLGHTFQTPFVEISWVKGVEARKEEIFQGILESFEVAYTMFNFDGEPLKAQVNLRFTNDKDLLEIAAIQNKEVLRKKV